MKPRSPFSSRRGRACAGQRSGCGADTLAWGVAVWLLALQLSPGAPAGGPRGQMETRRGEVAYTKPPAAPVPAATRQPLDLRDQLAVGESSWAIVRFRDASEIKVRELTQIEIVEPAAVARGQSFRVLRGEVYFSGLRRSTDLQVEAAGGVRIRPDGTEFLIRVSDAGTEVVMFHGEAELENDLGLVRVRAGELGVAEPGAPPRLRPAIEARNIVQWWLYYPAVLDPGELALTPAEQAVLGASLDAYRSGDLVAALARHPQLNRGAVAPPPASPGATVYHAGLLLTAGSVDRAQAQLDTVTADVPGARALRRLIAAVRGVALEPGASPSSAAEWLAASYEHQARHDLGGARQAAGQAVELSPQFAFGWQQVADLEFGFGRTREALRALDRVRALAPRHAQAQALRGFILSAENRMREAAEAFESALQLDPALGNAWLGRGLCRIRQRDLQGGLEDLQTAAVIEPNRSLLHSYLGKAYQEAAATLQARGQFERARQLDPNDPTPWLYEALAAQEANRINPAVRSLETSRRLNDNRGLFRSRLLLDQDRAIRGVHLASIYQDAGLREVSAHEAARAVAADYSSPSAHLFLADSYNAWRDPRQVHLRYETPWLSEYLLANLLAPVGAGTLAPRITPHEYSRFFDRDGAGFGSQTEYRSSGDWWESASQYGRFGKSAYAVDVSYLTRNGDGPNQGFENLTGSLRFKHEITPRDGIYVQALWYRAEGGDLRRFLDPTNAHRQLRFEERQEPLWVAGYHREWSPAARTLILGSRWEDTYEVRDPQHDVLLQVRNSVGGVLGLGQPTAPLNYRGRSQGQAIEWQQIQHWAQHTVVAGTRLQAGTWRTAFALGDSTPVLVPPVVFLFETPATNASVEGDFARRTVYLYDQVQVFEPLFITAGLGYDWIEFPANHRSPPFLGDQDRAELLSPKAGWVWSLGEATTFRGAYAWSLGGLSFDRSFQLEPTQLGGFIQTYRSLIPESVAGSVAGARDEIAGVALDQRFGRNTYLTASGEWLQERLDRRLGAFNTMFLAPYTIAPLRERLDFTEQTAAFAWNQLVGENVALGARYRCSLAELDSRLREVTAARQTLEATLQQVHLVASVQHVSGWFAGAESVWSHQSNRGPGPERPDEDFWQVNLHVGCRFARRRAEARLGLLNLTGQDYRLHPLNLTADLPRERVLTVLVRFSL